MTSVVYVGNLSKLGTRKEDLEREFNRYGNVKESWLSTDPVGFAFVTYSSQKEAETAVSALNGRNVLGTRVRVELSYNYKDSIPGDRPQRGGGFTRGFRSDRGGRDGRGYDRGSDRYAERRGDNRDTRRRMPDVRDRRDFRDGGSIRGYPYDPLSRSYGSSKGYGQSSGRRPLTPPRESSRLDATPPPYFRERLDPLDSRSYRDDRLLPMSKLDRYDPLAPSLHDPLLGGLGTSMRDPLAAYDTFGGSRIRDDLFEDRRFSTRRPRSRSPLRRSPAPYGKGSRDGGLSGYRGERPRTPPLDRYFDKPGDGYGGRDGGREFHDSYRDRPQFGSYSSRGRPFTRGRGRGTFRGGRGGGGRY